MPLLLPPPPEPAAEAVSGSMATTATVETRKTRTKDLSIACLLVFWLGDRAWPRCWSRPGIRVSLRPVSKSGCGFAQPDLEAVGVHHRHGARPAACVVALEVVVDRRDLRLYRAPQRPAHVRHEREQVHARQLSRLGPPEVRLAQDLAQVLA